MFMLVKNHNRTPHPFTAHVSWTTNQITGRQSVSTWLRFIQLIFTNALPRKTGLKTHTHTYPDISVHNASSHNIVPYFSKFLLSWDSPQTVVTHKLCHIPGKSMSWLISFHQATHLLFIPFTVEWLNFHASSWDSQVADKLDSFLCPLVVSMSTFWIN
jgi:hypothetical protein